MWLSNEAEELKQGSDAWLAWRRLHIGASDVSAIMGRDDFRTARDVFRGKIDGEVFQGNWATQRGKDLEPIIISRFEEKHKIRVSQPTLTYPLWPVLSASLDGYCLSPHIIVEAKAPAIWKHTMALCGLVPETYVDQVQTQLLVTGADHCYYVSYHDSQPDGFDYAEVLVLPDYKRQQEILEKCQLFWSMVERGIYEEQT
jgi:putative phage-type endonuclease